MFDFRFGHVRVSALLDSGASVTLVSEKVVEKAKVMLDSSFVNLEVGLAAGAACVRTRGRYIASLAAHGFSAEVGAICLPGLQYDLILGLDWLQRFQPSVDWLAGSMVVQNRRLVSRTPKEPLRATVVSWPTAALPSAPPSLPAALMAAPQASLSPPATATAAPPAAPVSPSARVTATPPIMPLSPPTTSPPLPRLPPATTAAALSLSSTPSPLPPLEAVAVAAPLPPRRPQHRQTRQTSRLFGPLKWGDASLALSAPDIFACVMRAGLANAGEPILGASSPSPRPTRPSSCVLSPPPRTNAAAATRLPTSPQPHDRWVREFPEVLRDDLPPGLPPQRPWDHEIPLVPGAVPYYASARRTSDEEDKWLDAELAELLRRGVIRACSSSFAAPILFVKKKDGTPRMCIDYRGLNARTQRNRYPLPLVDTCLDRIHGARFFSKFDLKSGFHQLRIAEADVHKTAFSTRRGLFEWLVCPFGLADMPATFQKMMDDIFGDLIDKGLQVYMDDILIATKTLAEHERLTREVLTRLRLHGLVVRPDKCVWCSDTVEFLGHRITPAGLLPATDKVSVIREWSLPSSTTELRGFLGVCNFVRRYIPRYSDLAAPLFDLLTRPVGTALVWSVDARAAFAALKTALLAPPALRIPDPAAPFAIAADASGVASGAVLLQHDSVQWLPVAFTGHKFSATERNWAIGDREMFAALHALRVWSHYVRGRPVRVFTDHAPLTSFFSTTELKPRHARWAGELSGDFDARFEYHKGTSELLAIPDAISRFAADPAAPANVAAASAAAAAPRLSLAAFAEGLQDDPEFAAAIVMCNAPADQPVPDSVPFKISRFRSCWSFQDGVLRFEDRVCVPPRLRQTVLDDVHGTPASGHFGVARTEGRLRRDWYWRGLAADVKRHVHRCEPCQKAKAAPPHTRGVLNPNPVATESFSSISLDFVSGFPEIDGCNQALIVVDSASHTMCAFPCHTTITAEAVADLLWNELLWLVGVPSLIISDRDKLFVSRVWDGLFRAMGTRLNIASTGHAPTDGQSERAVRTWTEQMRTLCGDDPKRWKQFCKTVCAAYNSSPHADAGATPHSLAFGHERPGPSTLPRSDDPDVTALLERQEALRLRARDLLIEARMREIERSEKSSRRERFEVGVRVLLDINSASWVPGTAGNKPKLHFRWLGPYEVLERIGASAYRLRLPPKAGNAHNSFHVSSLRRFNEPRGEPFNHDKADADDDNVFEVDRICGATFRNRRWYYAIKFKDQSLRDGHWLPRADLSCPDLLREFTAKHKEVLSLRGDVKPPRTFPELRLTRARTAAERATVAACALRFNFDLPTPSFSNAEIVGKE